MTRYQDLLRSAKQKTFDTDERRPLDQETVRRLLEEFPTKDAPPVLGGPKEVRRKVARPQTSHERLATLASRTTARLEREARSPRDRLAGCYMTEREEVVVDPPTKLPVRVTVHRTWTRKGGKAPVAFQQDDGEIIFEDDRAAPPVSPSGSAGWGFLRGRKSR